MDDLPLGWLIAVIFGATFVVTAVIYVAVTGAASGPGGPALRLISPGMLPPLGLVFGLIVGFLVAGLWADLATARSAVNREASALRSTQLVADAAFPGASAAHIDALIARHIRDAATHEWPAMSSQNATLTAVPQPLARALRVVVTLKPVGEGQVTAQRDLLSSLENALDARRQRIIVSQSTVNWVKWMAVIALGALTLLAIAFVHSGNRLTAALAMGVFAAAVAITLVLIATQDRPFGGHFGVKPTALLQVLPAGR
jgi:hypothetical protein